MRRAQSPSLISTRKTMYRDEVEATMNPSDLTELQAQILLLVHEEGGRAPTESVYDLVESVRPTHGAEEDEVDPYETSREELATLEAAGLLASHENTTWAMGATVLTDKGRDWVSLLADPVRSE